MKNTTSSIVTVENESAKEAPLATHAVMNAGNEVYPDNSFESTYDGKISDYLTLVDNVCDQAEELLAPRDISRKEEAEKIYEVGDLISRMTYQAAVVVTAHARMISLLGKMCERSEALAVVHGLPLPGDDVFWHTGASVYKESDWREGEGVPIPF